MTLEHRQLIDELCLYLEHKHYSSKTITSNYLPYWKKFLENISESDNISDSVRKCSQELNTEFQSGNMKHSTFINYSRALMVLQAFINGGEPAVRCSYNTKTISNNEMIKDYKTYLENGGKSLNTIRSYIRIAELFMEFLCSKAEKNIPYKQFYTEEFLALIHKKYSRSMKVVMNALRSFDKYLLNEGYIKSSVMCAFSSRIQQPQHIIRVLSDEDAFSLIKNTNSKRDKAVLLLAFETGIRSCDITNLELTDIKWKKKQLSFVQQKTGQSLILPMTTAVGNALADYILNERHQTNSRKVFVSSKPPYKALSAQACWQISAKLMKSTGIHQGKNEEKGLHCFRHRISNALLSENIPIYTVSSVLGHRSKESIKGYIASDVSHLKQCALDLSAIGFGREEFLNGI